MAEFLNATGLAAIRDWVKGLFVEKATTSTTAIVARSGCTVVTGSYQPTARRQGNVVTLEGAIRNTNARAAQAFEIGMIPEGFRPSQAIYRTQRCGTTSTPGIYWLVIQTSGLIQCGGIVEGGTVGNSAPKAAEAFYIGCSYIVDDSASSTHSTSEIMSLEESI